MDRPGSPRTRRRKRSPGKARRRRNDPGAVPGVQPAPAVRGRAVPAAAALDHARASPYVGRIMARTGRFTRQT